MNVTLKDIVFEIRRDGDVGIMEKYVNQNGNVNAVIDVNAVIGDALSFTILHTACFCGSLKFVDYIVRNGGDINSVDYWKRKPIHLALNSNKVSCFEYLFRLHDFTECEIIDLFQESAHRNSIDCAKVILDNSDVLEAINSSDMEKLLRNCCISDNTSFLKLLLDYGLNVKEEVGEGWRFLRKESRKEMEEYIDMMKTYEIKNVGI